jgi:hypothetical protein
MIRLDVKKIISLTLVIQMFAVSVLAQDGLILTTDSQPADISLEVVEEDIIEENDLDEDIIQEPVDEEEDLELSPETTDEVMELDEGLGLQVATFNTVSDQRNPIPFNYDREAQYEFLQNWEDPNYMSDETLFGRFDSNTNRVVGGHLDYDRFPLLDPVKEAVIDGDYPRARDELLEYYREKFRQITPIVNKYDTFSRTDLLSAKLAEYDMHWNGNSGYRILDIFTVGNKKDWYSIDLMSNIRDITNANEVTVYLVALKKDGSVAQFESRNNESGNAPYLEVTINNVTTRIKASDDTYTSPHENHAKIYGAEPYFMVEESVSSIGKGRDANYRTENVSVDRNTKRGYLKFNVSQIPKDASVESLAIKLYGSNVGDEGNTGDMEIVAFKINNNAWCEGGYTAPNGTMLGLSYHKSVNPIYNNNGDFTGTQTINEEGAIFSSYGEGWPGYIWGRKRDPVSGEYATSYRYHEDILRMSFLVPTFARLYNAASEDNDHYASVGIRQWAGFIQERGHTTDYTHQLDFSVRTRAIIYELKAVVNSIHMTSDIWSATVKYLWTSGDLLANSTFNNNNLRTFQGAGLAAVNAYFNEFKQHYEWASSLRWITSSNMGYLIRNDGTNREAAIGYAVYALDDMISWTNPNKEVGITDNASESLDGGFSGEWGVRLNKAFQYILDISGPGYVDNQMGDGSAYTNNFTGVFRRGYDALGNENLLYAITGGKEGKKMDYTSVAYHDGKAVVMRSNWTPDGVYLYSDVTPNTSHVHRAHNQIIMFAYGSYLLTDQLFYTYTSSDPIYNPIRATRMHNTVEIGNTSQAFPTENNGQLQQWMTNNAFDLSRLKTDASAGASHERNIVYIKPGFYIVSDYLVPKTTGTKQYKQHWHMKPHNFLELDSETGVGRTNFPDEANIIVATHTTEDITPSIDNTGLFSEGTGSLTSNVPYLRYAQETADNAVFDTLLVPEKFGDNIDVSTTKLDLEDVSNNGVTAMEFEIENETESTCITGSYYLVHDLAQKAERVFGDYSTDGTFAYAEKDKNGRLSKVMLGHGTHVSMTNSDKSLLMSNIPVDDLAVEYSTSSVVVSFSGDVDINQITFYTERKIDEVKINGQSLDKNRIKRSGGYIYFGDKPILIDDEYTSPVEPSPGPVNRPGHGVGGGPSGGGSQVPVPTPTVPDGETVITEKFSDLDEAAWAKEYINSLAEKGIVSGYGNGTFRPNDYVTREEFAKMLSETFEILPQANTDSPFEDIPKDHWAKGYVASLVDSGIVKGITDSLFGAGEFITRQDTSVMVNRAMEILRKTLDEENEEVVFADSSSISDYAIQSVQQMQKYGIINGDENDRFNPLKFATRAECAKILYMILSKI